MKSKDQIKVIIIIFISLIFTISAIFSVYKLIKKTNGDPNDLVYVATSNSDINYQIYIKNNNYIKENILNKNNSYITSLVDLIKINFKYNYSFDRNLLITYNYLIKANIISIYAGDTSVANPIINHEYILKNKTEDFKTDKSINLEEDLNLNLDEYNSFIKNFINEFGISNISNLEISLIVNITGKIDDYEINKQNILKLNIPLGVSVFDITSTSNFPDEEKVYYNPVIKKEINYAKMIIYIVIDILILALAFYLIKKIIDKYQSKYILEKQKILKEYDDRIVEVSNFIKYENWETIDVTNFEELLNLSNEAFEPIFFWERRKNHNREAWFCILREKVLYRYIIYKNEYIKNQTS